MNQPLEIRKVRLRGLGGPAMCASATGDWRSGSSIVIINRAARAHTGGGAGSFNSIEREVMMNEDLDGMSREQLIAEATRLRQGIRAHRDGTGHELCWHHPALWALLPERTDPLPTVPAWPQFMRGCVRYRQSLDEQLPHAPRSDAAYE